MVQDLADNQPVDYTRNGYVLARLARGASAKADGFLKHGVRAADGTFIAPALEPALKPVKGQMREFADLPRGAARVELRGRGMETGMSLAEAQAPSRSFDRRSSTRRATPSTPTRTGCSATRRRPACCRPTSSRRSRS
jgi:hypothetical protein